MNLTYLIKSPVVTEKTNQQQTELNRYTFEVDVHANKNQLKTAIEQYFGAKVSDIRTVTTKSKQRRTGRKRLPAVSAPTKKVIVTLEKNQSISLFQPKETK